jgi:hypothetical protein
MHWISNLFWRFKEWRYTRLIMRGVSREEAMRRVGWR